MRYDRNCGSRMKNEGFEGFRYRDVLGHEIYRLSNLHRRRVCKRGSRACLFHSSFLNAKIHHNVLHLDSKTFHIHVSIPWSSCLDICYPGGNFQPRIYLMRPILCIYPCWERGEGVDDLYLVFLMRRNLDFHCCLVSGYCILVVYGNIRLVGRFCLGRMVEWRIKEGYQDLLKYSRYLEAIII